MSMIVLYGAEQDYVNDGYKIVGELRGTTARFVLEHPIRTCLHKMRGWKTDREHQYGFCTLDKDHKGRHSTVTFQCDACGKTRRGGPSYSDEDVALCFMCVHVERSA